MKSNKFIINKISVIILVALCIASFLLLFPTVNQNVDKPNMIVYFNSDEGWLMDLAWFFYSGEKRESFQGDFDVGIGLIYLGSIAKHILSHFITITPGTLVLILRWLYMLSWISALIALWRLVEFHFEGGWQSSLAVMLLAVRPAMSYFSTNLKAEPLVLLIVIIGLYYTLCIIEQPFKKRNLLIAIVCASIAFLIKYAGFFLLPTIIASLYFSRRYQNTNSKKSHIFPEIKISWLFPSLIGLVLVALPVLILFFYVRKSTGFTWYEQYGLWGSLMQNKVILCMCTAGLFLIFLSFLIILLNKTHYPSLKKILRWINELNSYSLVVCGLFTGLVLLFGIGWIINPKYFINVYAQMGQTISGNQLTDMMAEKGLLYSFLYNLNIKIAALDVFMFFLFIFYLIVEIYYWRSNLKNNPLKLYKRIVLLTFLVAPFMIMLTMIRTAQHHMLPFFAAMSILSIQGFYVFNTLFDVNGRKLFKITVLILLSLLFITDIFINATEMIKSRIHQFRQKEDVVYLIAEWWCKNIPINTKIVADHYTEVYIPFGYVNVKTLHWDESNRPRRLRELIDRYHPEYVYYNEGIKANDEKPLPPLEEILPDKNIKLIKSFENIPGRYQSRSGARFVIYRIEY